MYDRLPPRWSPDNSPEARQARMAQHLGPPPDTRPRYILGPMNNVVGLAYDEQPTEEFPVITQEMLTASSGEL